MDFSSSNGLELTLNLLDRAIPGGQSSPVWFADQVIWAVVPVYVSIRNPVKHYPYRNLAFCDGFPAWPDSLDEDAVFREYSTVWAIILVREVGRKLDLPLSNSSTESGLCFNQIVAILEIVRPNSLMFLDFSLDKITGPTCRKGKTSTESPF